MIYLPQLSERGSEVISKESERFAKNLKLLMASRNVTALELSNKLKIPNSTISHYIRLQSEIPLHNAVKIAKFFDRSVEWFMDNGGEF